MSSDDVRDFQLTEFSKALAELKTDMRDGFASLERKLDERLESRDKKHEDHERRIRDLERKLNVQSGVNIILGAILTLVGAAAVTSLWALLTGPRVVP